MNQETNNDYIEMTHQRGATGTAGLKKGIKGKNMQQLNRKQIKIN
jgi:hypothetical protein